MYGRSARDILQPCESPIDFDDRVYSNLVRVFYSNIEISSTRLDMIVTQVGGVHIEFDDEDFNTFLGISNDSHEIPLGKLFPLPTLFIMMVFVIFVGVETLMMTFVLYHFDLNCYLLSVRKCIFINEKTVILHFKSY